MKITEKWLEDLCTRAAKKAVGLYITTKKENRKMDRKERLYNTRLLLENYRIIKIYTEKAKSSLSDIDSDDLIIPDHLLKLLGVRKAKSESISQHLAVTNILINHIDKMLDVFRQECEGSSKKNIARRWTVIHDRYLSPERKSTEELSEEFMIDRRVIQDDQKKAIETLSILFFGLQPLIDDIKGTEDDTNERK